MPIITNQRSRLIGGGRRGPAWSRAGGAPAPVAAYQPKGAASLAASYVNLVTPGTYNAAPGTAPTWDATGGWTFLRTSSQYLLTGITPAASRTYSMVVRYSDANLAVNMVLAGAELNGGAFPAFYTRISGVANIFVYANGATANGSAEAAAGVVGVGGTKAYLNGVDEGVTIGAVAGSIPEIYIGARDFSGVADMFASAKIQALAIYNVTLTASQVAAVSAAMALL